VICIKKHILFVFPNKDGQHKTDDFQIWVRICKGQNVFRVTVDSGGSRTIDTTMLLTSTGFKTHRRHEHMIRLKGSKEIIYTRKLRFIFPDFESLTRMSGNDIVLKTDSLRDIFRTYGWAIMTCLNIVVENPAWPLAVPGEGIWYERLHQGMTRRSLLKAQEVHAARIGRTLRPLIDLWYRNVGAVVFTFGDTKGTSNFDDNKDFGGLIAKIKSQDSNRVIRVE
jgi:hypothetical protein